MISRKIIRAIPLVLILLCSLSSADDLGKINLDTDAKTAIAEKILSNAISRMGNEYFVKISDSQKKLLDKTDIDYEIVKHDVDFYNSYMFFPTHTEKYTNQKTYDIYNLIDIGGGVKVGQVSRLSASNISDLTGRSYTLLSDYSIRFKYLSKKISASVSGITDFPTDALASKVNRDSVTAWVNELESFESRYIYTNTIDIASAWMKYKFTSWGYTEDISLFEQMFYYDGLECHNLYVVKQGYAEPDKVIVVGGHYDSITYGQPTSAYDYAPGADDNASGTAAVLEIARILADVPTRKTIIFIPFSAEEVGLVGSRFAATEFAQQNTDIEVMFNFDMIGYLTGMFEVPIMGNPDNINYANVTSQAIERVTALTPLIDPLSGSSDHWSFYQNGYNFVYSSENDFNFGGWHTDNDLSSRLNFYYMTAIIRGNAAAIAQIANSPGGSEIEKIIDQGDGQSMEVFVKDCQPTSDYKIYYSLSSGLYSDLVFVELPNGVCSHTFTGLTEGARYYFKVTEINEEGYPAIYTTESSEMPLIIPRAPSDFRGEPSLQAIKLIWTPNPEADLLKYNIYRNDGSGYTLIQDNNTDTLFIDNNIIGGVLYDYRITALDTDMNESELSAEITSIAATFDSGILLADETIQGIPMPNEANQEIYFNSIFGTTPFVLERIDGAEDPITKIDMAQYSSIFWIDNDFSDKLINQNSDSLKWYLGFNNNIFYSTFMTLSFLYGSPLNYGNFLFDEFGVEAFEENENSDFYGAKGQNGWPDILTDPGSPFGDKMSSVTILTPREGAEVIYTYDSFTDDPAFENQPCGLLVDTPNGKRIILGFPVFFLDEATVTEMINKAMIEFGEIEGEVYLYGDVNMDITVNMSDIIYFVAYMFSEGPEPVLWNTADVNNSCEVDISDLVYMIRYIFKGGPNLLEGCVN